MNAYDECIDDIKSDGGNNREHYGEGGNYCLPIRIINVTGIESDQITDQMPFFMDYMITENQLPLKEYDNLEGNPFWMRPEYLNERVIANTPHEMLVTKEARRLYGFEDVSLELLKKLGIPVVD